MRTNLSRCHFDFYIQRKCNLPKWAKAFHSKSIKRDINDLVNANAMTSPKSNRELELANTIALIKSRRKRMSDRDSIMGLIESSSSYRSDLCLRWLKKIIEREMQ